MIHKDTEEQFYLKITSSRKYSQQYKAERESRRLEWRRQIAAAILVEEMRRANNG